MNARQMSTARRVTTTIGKFMPNETDFQMSESDGDVLIFASTARAPWYIPYENAAVIIGPRGGVRVLEGNHYIRKWIRK